MRLQPKRPLRPLGQGRDLIRNRRRCLEVELRSRKPLRRHCPNDGEQQKNPPAHDDTTKPVHALTLTKPPAQSHTESGLPKSHRHNRRMTTGENLLQALREFEAAVAAVNEEPKPDLMAHFNRLDELTAQLTGDTDGELLHYLHKKSYEKARLFLEGRHAEIQKGGCLR